MRASCLSCRKFKKTDDLGMKGTCRRHTKAVDSQDVCDAWKPCRSIGLRRVVAVVLLIVGTILGVLAFRMSRGADFHFFSRGGVSSRQSNRFLEDDLRSAFGSQVDGLVSQMRSSREHREHTRALLIVGACAAICLGLFLFLLPGGGTGRGTQISTLHSEDPTVTQTVDHAEG